MFDMFDMSEKLSLKINEDIYREMEEITKKYHIPRNAYINQALSNYNKLNRRKILKKQLAFESGLVASNSLKCLQNSKNLKMKFPKEYQEISYCLAEFWGLLK